VVSHAMSYATNGYAIRTQAVALALSQAGLDVICFVRQGRPWDLIGPNASFPAQMILNGIRYIHIHKLSRKADRDQKSEIEQEADMYVKYFKIFKPAVVMAASNYRNSLPALLASRRLSIPFHYEVRGFWEITRASRFPDWNQSTEYNDQIDLESFCIRHADRVYTLNGTMRREVIARGGNPRQIHICPNGATTHKTAVFEKDLRLQLGIPQQSFLLCYIGSLVEYEGVDDLIRALAMLNTGQSFHLVVVGGSKPILNDTIDGKDLYANKLIKLAQDLGIKDRVCITGRVAHDEVAKYYSIADAMVIPRKPLPVCEMVSPLKPLEYISHGKTVIAADVGPLKEVLLNGKIGWLYKKGCVSSLTKEILKIANPENQQEVARKKMLALDIASKEYSWDSVIRPMLDHLLINSRKHPTEEIYPSLIPRHICSILGEHYLTMLRERSMTAGSFDEVLDLDVGLLRHYKDLSDTRSAKKLLKLVDSEVGALDLLGSLPRPQERFHSVPRRVMYIVHHSLPHHSNGYASRTHGLYTGMLAAGIDAICLTRPGYPLDILRNLESAPSAEIVEGANYLRLPEPRWTGPGRSRNYLSDAADTIEEQIRHYKPSCVMAASNYVNALPVLIAARRCGIPMAYEVRGFWEFSKVANNLESEGSLKFRALTLIESRLAAAADMVFTLSQTMKDELIRRKVPADKITLLPNCCDPDTFRPRPRDLTLAAQHDLPEDVPVIGYVGSFVDYEGLDDLTRACVQLRQQGQQFRLVLVGASDGPLVERIRKIAAEGGLEDWLILPGRVPHDQVEAWYSLIDIAPFPRKPVTVTELVTPLKPLEAMAMEKAVIMSSVGAMAEMVEDGVTGLVFQKGSAQALAGALTRVLADPELSSTLGRQARAFVVAERTWAKMGERVRGWIGPNDIENSI